MACAIAVIIISIIHGTGALDNYIAGWMLLCFLIAFAAYAVVYLLLGVTYIVICYFFTSEYRENEKTCQLYKHELRESHLRNTLPFIV